MDPPENPDIMEMGVFGLSQHKSYYSQMKEFVL